VAKRNLRDADKHQKGSRKDAEEKKQQKKRQAIWVQQSLGDTASSKKRRVVPTRLGRRGLKSAAPIKKKINEMRGKGMERGGESKATNYYQSATLGSQADSPPTEDERKKEISW